MSIVAMKQEIELTKEAIHQLEVKLMDLENKVKAYEAIPPRPIGTKFKWTKDAENYRVAVQTKKGVLQVKVVTNGVGDYHENCTCKRCVEIRLSNGQIPPWRRGPPLKMTLFENEFHWRESFDEMGGKMVITSAPIPRYIRLLRMMPLKGKTDARKLKELETRFPDSIITLIVTQPLLAQYDIKYEGDGISCKDGDRWSQFFWAFGEKYEILISWRGYIFDIEQKI